MLHELGLESTELPVVALRFGAERPALVNPSNLEIADAFGVYDADLARECLRSLASGRRWGRLGSRAAAVYASS